MFEKFTQTYLNLSEIPKIKGGRIIPGNDLPLVQLHYSQQDVKDNSSISYSKIFQINSKGQFPTFQWENVYHYNYSPSGQYLILFKDIQVDPKKNRVTETRIELWEAQGGRISYFGCKDLHGKVYTEASIQHISWNKDETSFLYIAERKEEEKKKFWDEIKKDSKDVPKYDFYEFKEDYGELMNEKSFPRLFKFDIKEKKSIEITNIPNYFAIQQPSFTKDGYLFVAFDTRKRRLGLRFCIQRESQLYQWVKDKDIERLAENEWNVHYPRLSPDMNSLCYLTTGKTGVHSTCEFLKVMDWDSKKISEIKTDIPLFENFSPLSNCFNGKNLIMELIVHSKHTIGIIDIESGKVLLIEGIKKDASFGLLDIYKDFILVSMQTPKIPFRVFLLKVQDLKESKLWNLIDQDTRFKEITKGIKWNISKNNDGIEYTTIYPKSNENCPLIVNPHGGPHSNSTTIFRMETLCYVLNGYAVITINYRGSTGYTKEFVDSLPGRVGDYDIKDVQNSVQHLLSKSKIDKENIFYLGGSHGGFIGGHVVGQYPDFYRAAILHNPVINLPTMASTSDIPDWCFCEAGFDPYEHEITNEEYQEKSFKMSPIYYVKNVKTPVLLLVGDEDKRVPPEQGRQFYYALKSRNVPTKLLYYKGQSHPIWDPMVSCDRVVQTLLWMDSYKSSK